MTTNSNKLISTKEASDLLGESIKNVTRRVSAGELTPVTKLPGIRGAFIFNAADVTTLKTSLDQKAPAKSASTDAASAGASVVSEESAA